MNSVAWYAAPAEARAVENTVRRDTQVNKARKTTSHRHRDEPRNGMGDAGDVNATPFTALFDDVWTTSSFGPAIAFISFSFSFLLLLCLCVLVLWG